VLPGYPNNMRIRLEHLARQTGITLNVALAADSMMGQIAFVAAGHGYTINPVRAICTGTNPGAALTAAKIVNPTIERTVTLSITTQRPASRAVREVAMALRIILMHQADSEAQAGHP
jgi:LysR family nitrogen assimilation transcriptional regulator